MNCLAFGLTETADLHSSRLLELFTWFMDTTNGQPNHNEGIW